MRLDSIEGGAPAERRQAVWPWLLVPLVTLVIFFALRSFREAPSPELPATMSSESAASD
jgi:hypothetical protein